MPHAKTRLLYCYFLPGGLINSEMLSAVVCMNEWGGGNCSGQEIGREFPIISNPQVYLLSGLYKQTSEPLTQTTLTEQMNVWCFYIKTLKPLRSHLPSQRSTLNH